MDRYTTYCTEEQTRKALELNAPIKHYSPYTTVPNTPICLIKNLYELDKSDITNNDRVVVPTAEQMFCWLEEQGFYFYIFKDYLWNGEVQYGNRWHYSIDDVCSRKEATLATIDKALNYLIKIKEETK